VVQCSRNLTYTYYPTPAQRTAVFSWILVKQAGYAFYTPIAPAFPALFLRGIFLGTAGGRLWLWSGALAHNQRR
jgi:hypothetical protein